MLFFPQDVLFPGCPGGGFSLLPFGLLTPSQPTHNAEQALLDSGNAVPKPGSPYHAWVPPSLPHPNTNATMRSQVIPTGRNTFPFWSKLLPHTEAGLSYTEPMPKCAFYTIAWMGWGMQPPAGFSLRSAMTVSSHAGSVVGDSWPQPQPQGIWWHWYVWFSNANWSIPQFVYLKLLLDF